MTKLQWLFGKRYELSGDGVGLLRYIMPKHFYHIHSDEMTLLERRKHCTLTQNKGMVRFST